MKELTVEIILRLLIFKTLVIEFLYLALHPRVSKYSYIRYCFFSRGNGVFHPHSTTQFDSTFCLIVSLQNTNNAEISDILKELIAHACSELKRSLQIYKDEGTVYQTER